MTTDHYVPDPDADTTALIDGFYAHLRAHGVTDEVLAAIRDRPAELLIANQHLVVDEPARHNVRTTLLLVAAHRSRVPVDLIEEAFVEPMAPFVREGTRAMLDNVPDPYRAMVELARSRETEWFGAGFEFHHPADDDDRFHADVHRCHYHEVLVANDAPELTPVMCAFDRNWIDAIDPTRHGFRFDRKTTIGTGGTHCPFHFHRLR
jgi:hypothetical protein